MVEKSFRQLKIQWREALEQAGVYAPAFELREIIELAAGIPRARQLAEEAAPLPEEARRRVEAALAERISGRPLQYMCGSWEFCGLEFFVGEGVLIPRPDTETLVETALRLCKGLPAPRIADLCSGTGCIAIALAKRLPRAAVTAVELSDAAWGYLTRNIAHNAAENVTPLRADVLSCCLHGEYHLILSNPPYIPTAELAGLQREVLCEPVMALDGSADGLLFYRELARIYLPRLTAGGWLAFEVGDTQSAAVRAILEENGYRNIAIQTDAAGFERVVYGQRG